MIAIIAGGRDFTNYSVLETTIDYSAVPITEICSGMAKGADHLGCCYAANREIPVKEFPADWRKGKFAGHKRNKDMGDYADCLFAFWDGQSRGTKNMIDYAYFVGLEVRIYNYDGKPIDAEGGLL